MKSRISLYPQSVFQPAPSEQFRETVEGGQKLDVTVHGNLDSDRVIVNCLPWSEYTLRPDANARYGIMARAADAVVVSVDNPGVGAHGSRLSRRLRADLRDGNGDQFAMMQHEALQHVAERVGLYIANSALYGYSQGTIMAMKLAPLLKPKSLILSEPVGVDPIAPKDLVRAFLADGKRDTQYKAENPRWFQDITRLQFPPQPATLLASVQMMSRGGYFASGLDVQGIKKTIVYGAESTVCTTENVDNLSRQLKGAEIIELENENHSILNSVGRMAVLFEELRRSHRL